VEDKEAVLVAEYEGALVDEGLLDKEAVLVEDKEAVLVAE
jgi:hypothetical protein